MNPLFKGALIGAGVVVLVFCLFFGGVWTGKACMKANIEKQLVIDDKIEIKKGGKIMLFKYLKAYPCSKVDKELAMAGPLVDESDYKEEDILK